jgi:hypothetical protein
MTMINCASVFQEEEAQLLAEHHRTVYHNLHNLTSGFHSHHHHHHHHPPVGPLPPAPSIILQEPLLHAAPPEIYVSDSHSHLNQTNCMHLGRRFMSVFHFHHNQMNSMQSSRQQCHRIAPCTLFTSLHSAYNIFGTFCV